MTTKSEPTQPARQDGTTIVLDVETLAHAGEAATRSGESLDAVSELTAELSADSGELVGNSGDTQQIAATSPRLPTAAPPANEPPQLPSHMLPAGGPDDPGATTQLPIPEAQAAGDETAAQSIPDEVDPVWEVADQPTVMFAPTSPERNTQRPAFLETGEHDVWPPRPTPGVTPVVATEVPVDPYPRPTLASAGPVAESVPAASPFATGRPRTLAQVQPAPIPRPVSRPISNTSRLASPTGRPPLGTAPSAYSNPRMRRLVELRLQRDAHRDGQRGPEDNLPVAQVVRQWWTDLLPGLQRSLDHMHEARESGIYPVPAHDPTVVGRLGDAFGRVTRTARDLGERAQAAAAPAITRLHEHAEHAAQAIVDRIEGPQVRQQAPLLGPGRLAVFFQQGVTVVQAQRLLVTNRARPMRLIPRRHGFLALVQPGQEPVVGEQLRQHPYVRDVVYLEFDANGEPLPPR